MSNGIQIRYLTTREAADYLGLGLSTMERLRRDGTGPKYVRVTALRRPAIRYRTDELDHWATSGGSVRGRRDTGDGTG